MDNQDQRHSSENVQSTLGVKKYAETVWIGNQRYMLAGVQLPDGERGVAIKYRGELAYIPLKAFFRNKHVDPLEEQNIPIFSTVVANELRHCVGNITHFRKVPGLATKPGWGRPEAPYFTLSDGATFIAAGTDEPELLFPVRTGAISCAGTQRQWTELVAEKLQGQWVLMFFVMAAFAGPLVGLFGRSGNPGLELVGPPRTGKSLALQLMASVSGRAHFHPTGTFISSAGKIASRSLLEERSDLAIIVDDREFFRETVKPAGAIALRDLVQKLHSGHDPSHLGSRRSKLIYAFSSETRMASHLNGFGRSPSEIARDRLVTIPILSNRPFGVLDFLPVEFASSADYVETLRDLLEHHHGTAIRDFLKFLVDERTASEVKLRSILFRHRDAFIDKVKPSCSSAAALAAAECCAMVYAAGRLAKRAGVLPQDWTCLKAALRVYRNHLKAEEPRSFHDRLMAIVRHPETYDIRSRGLIPMRDQELGDHVAFARYNRAGVLQLLLTQLQLQRNFPDWLSIRRHPDVRKRLRTHQDRDQTQCQIRSNKPKDRVYCFSLEPSEG